MLRWEEEEGVRSLCLLYESETFSSMKGILNSAIGREVAGGLFGSASVLQSQALVVRCRFLLRLQGSFSLVRCYGLGYAITELGSFILVRVSQSLGNDKNKSVCVITPTSCRPWTVICLFTYW